MPLNTQLHTSLRLTAAALGMDLLLFMVFSYINAGFIPPATAFLEVFFVEGWPILLQTVAMMHFLYYSIGYFNHRHAAAPNAFKRYVEEVLFVFVVGFLLMDVFRLLFEAVSVEPEADAKFLARKLRQLQMVAFAQLAVVYGFMTSFRIFAYLQQQQVQLIRVQRELAQSQFEALKNQLNPHFLFNSLSVLSSLVYTDGLKAEKFVEYLSKTYRYILEQKDKETVPLSLEYHFLERYRFLLEQRFAEKLHIEADSLPTGNEWQLPPHTFLIVLEHIIHSNSMSAKQPLKIELAVELPYINITYSRQPKHAASANTVEQFERLQQAFEYAIKKPVRCNELADKALIQLPMLHVAQS